MRSRLLHARLLEQRHCALEVALGRRDVAMPRQARRDDPGGALGDAEVRGLEHGIDVDRLLDRLAHADVGERRVSTFMPSQT